MANVEDRSIKPDPDEPIIDYVDPEANVLSYKNVTEDQFEVLRQIAEANDWLFTWPGKYEKGRFVLLIPSY